MRAICFAAVAATMLGACATATTDNGSGSGMGSRAEARAPAGKQYCLESRLASAGGKHSCNWATNKATACEGDTPFTAMDANRYTAPRASLQCSNGRRVVEMAPLA